LADAVIIFYNLQIVPLHRAVQLSITSHQSETRLVVALRPSRARFINFFPSPRCTLRVVVDEPISRAQRCLRSKIDSPPGTITSFAARDGLPCTGRKRSSNYNRQSRRAPIDLHRPKYRLSSCLHSVPL